MSVHWKAIYTSTIVYYLDLHMRITALIGAIGVLCLLTAQALSLPELSGCQCRESDCKKTATSDPCNKGADCRLMKSCACAGLVSFYSGTNNFDPESTGFGAGRASSASKNGSRGQSGSGGAAAFRATGFAGASAFSSSSVHSPSSVLPPPSAPSAALHVSAGRALGDIGPPDPDVVQFLPLSARQVIDVLADGGPLTQKEIINRTSLPPRTVRYALDRLRDEEMLMERFCFRDARQSLYSLTGM